MTGTLLVFIKLDSARASQNRRPSTTIFQIDITFSINLKSIFISSN